MQDGKHVILCVDDDPSILDWLRIVLEAAGYIVVCAETAEKGLKKYKEVKPDLIIADLMIEEIDSGTNFVKELKALGNTTPVYMLSAAGDELNRVTNYSDLGLEGVFQKPTDPDALLHVVNAKLKK